MVTDDKLKNAEKCILMDSEVKGIFDTYLNVISPFVVQLEVLDDEFPVEILNEIRSIFTHLARSAITDKPKVYSENIIKAERHVKRAVLDCFKYLCYVYENKYIEFEKLYKNVDLSLIDNGKFLPELCKRRKYAVELLNKAKEKEIATENVNDTFEDFESAYNAFADVYKYINDSYENLQNIKQRALKKDICRTALDICGVIGTIFGIIGVVLAILK